MQSPDSQLTSEDQMSRERVNDSVGRRNWTPCSCKLSTQEPVLRSEGSRRSETYVPIGRTMSFPKELDDSVCIAGNPTERKSGRTFRLNTCAKISVRNMTAKWPSELGTQARPFATRFERQGSAAHVLRRGTRSAKFARIST